jgi:L-amino acid N-acyltransferase YncA
MRAPETEMMRRFGVGWLAKSRHTERRRQMTAGVAIRMAGVGDAAAIAGIYRPYVTGAVTSFEVTPPGAAEMAGRIETVLALAPWLVALDDAGAPIGYAYASRHAERAAYQWSVDVTVYVREGDHRRGVGRALYGALFPLLGLQGFYVAHAGITLPNAGSVGLHESFGFRPVGVYPAVGWKLGAWRDVGWWQLPLQERPATPAPPRPLAEAQELPAWPASLRTNG